MLFQNAMVLKNHVNSRIAIHRSFKRDVEHLLLAMKHVSTVCLTDLPYGPHAYPLLCVQTPPHDTSRASLQRILITAGVHGDEPAGVHAALDFLRDIAPTFSDCFQFYVLPCVNPSGFEANTLATMTGVNINRSFTSRSTVLEVRAIKQWLRASGRQFRATFDLHEAPPYYQGEGFTEQDNPSGTYLYEMAPDDGMRIGHDLIRALPPDVEICTWPTIYHDVNDCGVIAYPTACRNSVYAQRTTLDAYVHGRYTQHSFTTETPTGWSLEKRIATHLTYLCVALQLMSRDASHRRHRPA